MTLRCIAQWSSRPAAACALLCAAAVFPASAKQPARPDFAALFPQAADAPHVDRDGVSVRWSRRGSVRVDMVRFTPQPGLSQAVATSWCGITLSRPHVSSQAVITIGAGVTQALSCDGIADIGSASSKRGPARIALVYRTRSPNAAALTPVIVSLLPNGGIWQVDEVLSDKAGQLPGSISLSRLRRFLATR